MKKILLLGGSAQQVIAIETAKRLGFYTILCDYLPDNPGQYHADKFYLKSTTDLDAIMKVAEKERADGILAYASDPAAPTAAYVAENLGLPTNPLWSVDTICHKDRFRKFLQENGFNAPESRGYSTAEEIFRDRKEWSAFTLPVIVKPVDSSGSKGATVMYDWNKLDEAIDFAFSFSRSHRLIIEEYIEKKHSYLIGGDIFVYNGNVILWGLMNCHRDDNVNPLVPVGKSYPPLLPSSDIQKIKDTLQNMVNKLEIRFGSMNVELIIDKDNRVWPIDIGPRAGGNMIPDLMGLIFDVDVVEMAVKAVMGISLDDMIPSNGFSGKPFYATHNLHTNKNGFLEAINFSPEIEKYMIQKCLYKKPGDKVYYFDNAAEAIGIIFMKFSSEEEMLNMLLNVNRFINVAVDTSRCSMKE